MDFGTLDERGGYFYEALLSYAIRTRCKRITAFEVHKRLTEHSVVSDVVIPSASAPEAVILCTHSHATSGTHMKSWRNIDEMLLIREHFSRCSIINLIFPSEWKADLILLMGEICDLQIVFPENLVNDVLQLANAAVHRKISTAGEYQIWLDTCGLPCVGAVAGFLGDRLDDFFARRERIRPQWKEFYRSKPAHKNCVFKYAGDCRYKKGCNKLALLDAETRSMLWEKREHPETLPEDQLEKLLLLRMIREEKRIVRRLSVDESVSFVLNQDPAIVEKGFSLVSGYHAKDLHQLTAMVCGDPETDFWVFTQRLEELRDDSRELAEYIYGQLVGFGARHPNMRNLPLDYLYVIAKSMNKRFSHKVLSDRCGLPMIGGVSPVPEFLYGKRELPDDEIRKIAAFFAQMLQGSFLPDREVLWERLLYECEDKLMKHPYVNYLVYSVIAKCMESGFTAEHADRPAVQIGNAVADYCSSEHGNGLSKGTARTEFSFVIRYRETEFIFLVISAYAATHKHKEYPARWRCANIICENGVFRYAAGKRKWIVVLDGIWKALFRDFQDVLEKFRSAGADAVIDVGTFLRMEDVKGMFDQMVEG